MAADAVGGWGARGCRIALPSCVMATDPEDPDSDDAREGPGDRPAELFTGFDAVYTAAFSKIIKNIQRNLAPAWRVTIPVIPPIAFKLPPVPVVQLAKLDLGIYG